MIKNVLVFAAHPDDELLGQGGTIRKLVNAGVTARAVILAEGLTSRRENRLDTDPAELLALQDDARKAAEIIGYSSIDFCGFPDNRMDGKDLLDIIKVVDHYVDKYKPDTIFTHHHGDLNVDHRLVCEAVITDCRPIAGLCVKRIYAFETPSCTEWNFMYSQPFIPNVFVDVTDTIEAKVNGLKCYRSENREYPHPRSPEGLRCLARTRAVSSGFEMAEAFMLLRNSVDNCEDL